MGSGPNGLVGQGLASRGDDGKESDGAHRQRESILLVVVTDVRMNDSRRKDWQAATCAASEREMGAPERASEC